MYAQGPMLSRIPLVPADTSSSPHLAYPEPYREGLSY